MTVNPTYLDSIKMFVYLPPSGKTEITADVVGEIRLGDIGIMSSSVDVRVSDTPYMRFTLRNDSFIYTPGGTNQLVGWDTGLPVELELTYSGNPFIFRFYIDEIVLPESVADIYVEVSCVGWMNYTVKYPIETQGILASLKGNEVINKLLEIVPIPPQEIELDEGINTFPTAFDTVSIQTTAYDEFVKVALSELGYIYVKWDRVFGETLRFENATRRNGLRRLSVLPIAEQDSGFLLNDTGGFLLNDTGGKLVLDEAEDAAVIDTMMDIQTVYSKRNVINHFTMQANPRRIDTTIQILFKLDKPVAIGSGQIVEIRGTYADPAGGDPINAQGLVDPVITTDYLANTQEDGGGSNISTSIELVSVQSGTEGFVHKVKNNNTVGGYITKYHVRGYGIYLYNPITHVTVDPSSIEDLGVVAKSITQKYKSNLYEAAVFARSEVFRDKDPRLVIDKLTFHANSLPSIMTMFLNLQSGSLVRLVSTKHEIDGHYYVQGLDDVRISQSGLITFKHVYRESISYLSGALTPVTMEFGGTGVEDGIFFEYLPHVSNIQQRSYSFWVKRVHQAAGTDSFFMGGVTDANGMGSYGHNANGKVGFWVKTTGNQGTWEATTPPLTNGVWFHIVWTYDKFTPAVAPNLYVNGSLSAITAVGGALTGSIADETGVPFSLGNIRTATFEYEGTLSGQLKDCRVYNRILSASDVIELYNSGVADPSVLAEETDGLVFQSSFVKTHELDEYIDLPLEDDHAILDNVYSAVGYPVGNPIARSF